MSGYTGGGWHRNIPPISKYPVIFAGRNTHIAVVETKGLPIEEAEANARLIAAAPQIAQALKEAARDVKTCLFTAGWTAEAVAADPRLAKYADVLRAAGVEP